MPFAALAEALAARGHAVTAVAWELYRAAFEEAGVAFVAAGPATTMQDIAATAARAAAVNSPLAQVAVLSDFHLREAGAHYRAPRTAGRGSNRMSCRGFTRGSPTGRG